MKSAVRGQSGDSTTDLTTLCDEGLARAHVAERVLVGAQPAREAGVDERHVRQRAGREVGEQVRGECAPLARFSPHSAITGRSTK